MYGIAEANSETWPQLVVHEAGRRWIDGMRSRLAGLPMQVRHSASARDTLAIASQAQRCVVLAELGRHPIETLDLLEQLDGLGRGLTVIVVARSDQSELEIPSRELGAAAFLTEPMTVTELANAVEPVARVQFGWEKRSHDHKEHSWESRQIHAAACPA
jgi:DNA-binding NtrC family response regulator